ncbi:hypothetical protein K3495_g3384 [Podosphaera aphanis]|nr:hypothetical protein K3495_g3384 [Podosphaera aphanis]
MSIIKPIDGRAVYQIQSGQVIVDLCSVAKELVENSLDARATSIDVKFKNHGLAGIEVQDNGDGIPPQNYETLALKHCTSKLSNYSDLATLQTFGFRGEALSSLCALSVLKVTTCLAQDTPKGTRLEFEISGKLKQTSVIAAQKGTTVSIENLFSNLPVRRQELERNIKREWSKVIGVLGQYACIQTGVRFSVSQQSGSGKKTIILSTNGNQMTKENIANIFGAKTLTALAPLDLSLNLEAKSGRLQDGNNRKQIRLVGHVSLPFTGEVRLMPDRQMFFLNARPCSLPQIAKIFVEVYKSFNGPQSPFIFANIQLDTHLYDVNVSPDKRTILLHDQNSIIEALKSALTEYFESQNNTMPVAKLPMQKQTNYLQLKIERGGGVTKSSQNVQGTCNPTEKQSKINKSSSVNHVCLDQDILNSDSNSSFKKPPSKSRLSSSLFSHSNQSKSTDLEDDTSISEEDNSTRNLYQEPKFLDSLQKGGSDSVEIPDAKSATIEIARASTSAQPSLDSFSSNHDILGHLDSKRRRINKEFDFGNEEPTSPKTPAKISSFTKSNSISLTKTATPHRKEFTATSSAITPCPRRNFTRNAVSSFMKIKDQPALSNTLSTPSESLNQNTRAGNPVGVIIPGKIDTDENLSDEAYFSQMSQLSQEASECIENYQIKNLKPSDTFQSGDYRVITEVTNIEESSSPLSNLDSHFIDEEAKKAEEEAKVQEMIQNAEKSAALLCLEKLNRSKTMFKRTKKDSTLNLVQTITTNIFQIKKQKQLLERKMSCFSQNLVVEPDEALESMHAEERLSLTISKGDFAQMRVIGQFNLGFIIVSRSRRDTTKPTDDDLFIIDQHASDEKYNFERLQATTIIQSQNLVIPKPLRLTPVEEEIVLDNLPALRSNGFRVALTEAAAHGPVGQRCQLTSLPLSRETAFSLADFTELVSLLAEHPPSEQTIARPSRVRKLLAMRACRSSIMIGTSLARNQMEKVVRHLGELDKPWNCPHGRPTMRHLCGLSAWDAAAWSESRRRRDVVGDGARTNWALFLAQAARSDSTEAEDEPSLSGT